MDYPTLPSPIGRPPKRQRRVSQDAEDQSKLETHLQQSSNGTNVEAKVGHILFGRKRTKTLILRGFSDTPYPYGGVYETFTLQ
jgi:hypothetical protein